MNDKVFLKKEARFNLEGEQRYKVSQKVPVYTNDVTENKILGYATIVGLEKTSVREIDNKITPYTLVTLELEDELLENYPEYAIFYMGSQKRLALYNKKRTLENQKLNETFELNKRREKVKQAIQNLIISCENCDFSMGLTHDIDMVECPNCEGELVEI